MEFDSDYRCDTEFPKLLTRRSNVDLTVAALELARDAYPDLDFAETLNWIDETGRQISGQVAAANSEGDALKIVADCISVQHAISGDTETYSDPDNSYLNRVIQRRRGIPISLSLLYMAVADRAGLILQGVSTPAHFLTRYEAVEGPIFIDAFCGGCVLSYDEALHRACEVSGLPPEKCEMLLEPVSARKIVIRMLNNLKAIHSEAENWPAAWMVQHRLVLLQPGSYSQRRDLGLIALRADRPGQAIDMLEGCLNSCPAEEAEHLTAQLDDARRQLTRWN
jgi:regulator of sirC expression with transglutaminase-like and TPR domain